MKYEKDSIILETKDDYESIVTEIFNDEEVSTYLDQKTSELYSIINNLVRFMKEELSFTEPFKDKKSELYFFSHFIIIGEFVNKLNILKEFINTLGENEVKSCVIFSTVAQQIKNKMPQS